MDGTIYLGKKLFPQTRPFLNDLARLKIGHSYVTNNCSRSRAEYVRHLREIGIEADPNRFGPRLTRQFIIFRSSWPGQRLFVHGTPGLKKIFGWPVLKSSTRNRMR